MFHQEILSFSKKRLMSFGKFFIYFSPGNKEDSVIDFENEEDMNAVEDLIENIFAEDYALAGLFAEKRQELNVQRYVFKYFII